MLASTLRTIGSRLSINSLTNAICRSASSNATPATTLTFVNQPSAAASNNDAERRAIFANVNQSAAENAQGRLFAVVHLCGKQFKVTAGDVLLVEGYWAPQCGDRIRLDKVLVAGGADFSLIGRPLLQPGLVDVRATVIEKTLTHTKTHFRKKRRKQYMRINFHRSPNTMLMINSVELTGTVGGDKATDGGGGTDLRIF